eukprot:scaffold722_cov255-Prasinococcus_capsulatus_cf.AAC.7
MLLLFPERSATGTCSQYAELSCTTSPVSGTRFQNHAREQVWRALQLESKPVQCMFFKSLRRLWGSDAVTTTGRVRSQLTG